MESFHYLRWRLRHALPRGNARKLLVIAFLVLALPVTVLTLQQVQRYRTGAEVTNVNLYFEPGQQTLPPDSNFKLMANAGTNEVAFIRVDFSFDPTKVQLASEMIETPLLGTIVQKTSMASANATGIATLVIAKSPVDQSSLPTGIFEIANVNITSVTQEQNALTALSYVDSTVQLVDLQSQLLPHTSQSANLTLNQSVVSTPTSLPTEAVPVTTTVVPTESLPTNTVTTAPTSTNAPTATSTSVPLATNTSAPAATNTNVPTATSAPKIGDVNGDGVVGITDIGIIIDFYGTTPPGDSRADLNNDGKVNIVDIGIVVENYGS